MNEQELRAMIRDAVARHMGGGTPLPVALPSPPLVPGPVTLPHPSHGLYISVVNTTDACVIEPSVSCDHCGYCKSHGH